MGKTDAKKKILERIYGRSLKVTTEKEQQKEEEEEHSDSFVIVLQVAVLGAETVKHCCGANKARQ